MFISRSYRLRHFPVRLATGAYILNSGITKRSLDEQTAGYLQSSATRVAPFVRDWSPATFGRRLSSAEIAVGSVLLAPFVPSGIAGAVLSAFSGGLVTMYVRSPKLHHAGSLRPTQDGSAIAKDSWMLGIGLSLLIDACLARRARKRAGR